MFLGRSRKNRTNNTFVHLRLTPLKAESAIILAYAAYFRVKAMRTRNIFCYWSW